MTKLIHRYFHPLSGRLVFWNVLLLIFIKLVLPQSAFQFATLVGSIPTFDSREIIRLTNEARSINQLMPLSANSHLDLAAEEKLNDMAVQEYFAHVSPSGVTPWFWIQKAQYRYKVAGENLAIGFTNSQDTLNAWLNSPSHKANILNSQYRDIGVAVKGVKIGSTTGILVVQMFGSSTQTTKPPARVVAISNPTPSITPKSSPILITPTVSSQTKGEIIIEPELTTKELEINNQRISTDIQIPAVTEPSRVQFQDNENTKKLTEAVNNTFIIYSSIFALLSIIAFFVLEKNRHMALKMSLHAAIFILAVLVPVAEVTLRALIF